MGKRPSIEVTVDQLRVNNEAIAALAAREGIYQKDGALVRVVREPEDAPRWVTRRRGAPVIHQLPGPTLSEELSAAARFYRVEPDDKDPEEIPALPPDWCVKALLERHSYPKVRHLRAVVEAPILREDGSILSTPGYDAATGVLYEPRQSFPEVPAAPTWEQVQAARDQLLDIAIDFPFAQECHRAAWLAGLLTPFARFAYDGYTPFFLVDATTAGSGKGTLVDVVSVLISGGEATRMSHSPNREEEEKRVASMLLTGDLLICVDNISKPFGSDIFDMLITGKTFSPRLLGTNTMLRLTNSSIWWGNGNNVKIKEGADTTRRTLHMRLEPKEEAPDLRDDFKHPNLIEHVLTHRPQLVTAALTILRAYMLARPTAGIKLRSWKSFEEWGQVVRGAVVYVGLPDPYEAHELFRSSSDPVAFALEEVMHGWRALCAELNEEAVTLNDAVEAMAEDLEYKRRTPGHRARFARLLCGLGEILRLGTNQVPSVRDLQYLFRTYRGRIVSGMRLDACSRDRVKGLRWMVVSG